MSRSSRVDRWRGVLRLALAGVVAACSPAPTPTASPPPPIEPTSPPSAAPTGPALAFATCPNEVSVVMVIVPTCAYLVVPEDHDKPGGPTIRILVIRIEPPGGIEAPDPMVIVGETLGASVEYGGFAAHAQRTGRLVYVVDRRGTGLSEPLDCPEVLAWSRSSLSVGARDPAAETGLLDAVDACRARLTSAGIDLAAYGLRQSALDVESLRIATGHGPWNVIAFGSSSRLAIEVARQDPDGVRTVVMDSPVLPQGPDPMFAASATGYSIEQVQSACAAEPACRDEHPDVPGGLEQAVEKLDAAPAVIRVARSDGSDAVDVLVDGVRFARAARAVLAEDGGATIDELLDSIEAAREGRLTATDAIVRTLVRDDALCLGYVPDCRRIVTGSLLTTVCGDVLPSVDSAAAPAAGAYPPGMAGVFETNPFFAACAVWGVRAEPGMSEPVAAPPPLFAMVGRFDPFTGPARELVDAAGFDDAVVLELPNHSYNVFGFNECPRQVRRQWLDSPDHMPDTTCFADLRTVDLSG